MTAGEGEQGVLTVGSLFLVLVLSEYVSLRFLVAIRVHSDYTQASVASLSVLNQGYHGRVLDWALLVLLSLPIPMTHNADSQVPYL